MKIEQPSAAGVNGLRYDMAKREIFILEDDPAIRKIVSLTLAGAGYEPVCFADAAALLTTARQRYPYCILLDVCVPGRSGLEVLDELSSENYLAPIFMISGHANISMALRAIRKGAEDFIEKPFKGSELLKRIEDGIERRRTLRSRPSIDPSSVCRIEPFTRREREIVELILEGRSTKEIARLLDLSPRTIEDHRSKILNKAGVKTTAQLVLALLATREATDNPLHLDLHDSHSR